MIRHFHETARAAQIAVRRVITPVGADGPLAFKPNEYLLKLSRAAPRIGENKIDHAHGEVALAAELLRQTHERLAMLDQAQAVGPAMSPQPACRPTPDPPPVLPTDPDLVRVMQAYEAERQAYEDRWESEDSDYLREFEQTPRPRTPDHRDEYPDGSTESEGWQA